VAESATRFDCRSLSGAEKTGADAGKQSEPGSKLRFSVLLSVREPDLRLNPSQVLQLLSLRPGLAEHACRQQGLGRFGEKVHFASLPHIVEHLLIDRLVEEYGFQVAGNTRWQNRATGSARVTVQTLTTEAPTSEHPRHPLQARFDQLLQQAIRELEEVLHQPIDADA